jgi:hypothetical protein
MELVSYIFVSVPVKDALFPPKQVRIELPRYTLFERFPLRTSARTPAIVGCSLTFLRSVLQ